MTVSHVIPAIHAGVLRDRKPTGRADAGRLTPAAVSAVRADTVPAGAVRVTAAIHGAGPAVSRTTRVRVYPAARTLTVRADRVIVIPDTQGAAEAVSRIMLTRVPACRARPMVTARVVHVIVIPGIR